MTYNGEHWMKKCLDSFHRFNPIDDYEWIIMDTGSTNPKTKELVFSYNNDNLKYYYVSDADKSFSWVNNEAAKYAKGDYLLFLNNDVEFINNYSINNMMLALEKYSAGCVGARLFYPTGKIQHAGVIFRMNKTPRNMRHKRLSRQFLDRDREYQAVTAACMLCKKEDFKKVGGFDERYYYCFEDVDLCLKLKHQYNKPSVYCGNTGLIHHESRTILALDNKKQEFARSAKLLKYKWIKMIDVNEFKYLKDPNYKVMGG